MLLNSLLLLLAISAGVQESSARTEVQDRLVAGIRSGETHATPSGGAPQSERKASLSEYSRREPATRDLETFSGGNAGLIIAISLIVAVVILVSMTIPW
jgi:hypothetical protein